MVVQVTVNHPVSGSNPDTRANLDCGLEKRYLTWLITKYTSGSTPTSATNGPFVYRLGHSLFMAVSGVRFSNGLPKEFNGDVA